MTVVTRDVSNDGLSSFSYTYDTAQANLITSGIVTQDASTTRNLTIRLVNPSTRVLEWTGTRAFGTGQFIYDLSGLGVHMVASVDKTGATSLVPPFNIECVWT